MKLKIWYSIVNGGDGSAYPTFMESKELTEWDQNHMYEGWGETCNGSISFESESDIKCLDEIVTKEQYLIEKYLDENDVGEEYEEFVKKFFSDGIPKFTVTTSDPYEVYIYNNVFIDDKLICRVFKNKDESGKVFEKYLNSVGLQNKENHD